MTKFEFNKGLTHKPRLIVEHIRSYIDQKKLSPGDRLPSERELSEKFKISHTTVRSGLTALVKEGVIERRVGQGSFVANPRMEETAKASPPCMIAMVNPGAQISSPTIGCRILGIRQVFSQDDFSLDVLGYAPGTPAQAMLPTLLNHRVSGLLYQGFMDPKSAACLRQAGISFVSLGVDCQDDDVPQISFDYEGLYNRLVHEAYRLGHRRLVACLWADHPDTIKRLQGRDRCVGAYQRACRQFDLIDSVDHVIHLPLIPSLDPALVDARPILKLAPLATCYVVTDEIMAAALMRDAQAMGLSIPEDISVVALTSFPQQSSPVPLTASDAVISDQTRYRMAALMLRDLMAGRPVEPVKKTFQPEVVYRRSLGTAPSVPVAAGGLRV